MAVVKSGVVLVVEAYSEYMSKLDAIQKKQAETFSGKGMATPKIPDFPTQPGQQASKFDGIIKTLTGDIGQLGNFLTGLLSKFALVTVAIKAATDIIGFFSSSLQVAQRNETLGVSLNEVGKQAGYTAEQIAYAEQKLKVTGITTQGARQALLQMAQANISFAKSSELARIAQGAAVIGDTNSSEAFQRMITGIQRGEIEILKTIGLNVNFEASYKKLKKELNTKELNEQQKMQARMNSVLEAGIPIQGVYGAALETSGKQQASMSRYVEESQANFGKLLLPIKEVSVAMETDFWKGMNDLTLGLSTAAPVIENVINLFEEMQYKTTLPPDVLKSYDIIKGKLEGVGISSQEAASLTNKYISELKKGEAPSKIYENIVKDLKGMKISGDDANRIASELTKNLVGVSDSAKKIENTNFGLKALLGPLGILIDTIPGVEISFEQMGKGAQRWIQMLLEAFTLGKSIVVNFVEIFKQEIGAAGEAMAQVRSGDFAGAWDTFNKKVKENTITIEEFKKRNKKALDDVKAQYPDLYKSWDELKKGVKEVDLNLSPITGPDTSQAEDNIDKLKEELEGLKDAYSKIEDIFGKYNEDVANAAKERDKSLAEEDKKYAKEREQTLKKQAQEMAQFQEDQAIKRQQMISDFEMEQKQKEKEFNLKQSQDRKEFELKQRQDKKAFYSAQKDDYKKFQLEMFQDARRFALQDKRMQAEGDVVALMQAREDFALQQQEKLENNALEKDDATKKFEEQQALAEESFKLQEQLAQESFALQTQMQQEEFAKRLQEFDANTALEMERMAQANAEELTMLDEKHEEEKAKIQQQYEDKLAAAAEQKAKELEELGKAMADEGKVTEEGMKQIADTIAQVYGDEGAGDLLIKGWGERASSEMGKIMADLNAQIEGLKNKMDEVTQQTSSQTTNQSTTTPSWDFSEGHTPPNSSYTPPTGMRQGGVGVVTGPKLFEVEAGQKEAVMFAPLPTMSKGSLDVNMKGGFNIKGSGPAGKEATEAALDQMVFEFSEAVKRIGKR